MLEGVIAGGVIFLVLLGWIVVQQLARRFAADHPEWGPYRDKLGCGGDCGCSGGGCRRRPD
jgi:hypothetical protein